jgi:transposase-like protein
MRIAIKFELKQERALCSSYVSGASIESLAFEYGVSTTVIRRILKMNEIQFRPRGAPKSKVNPTTVAKAKSLRSMGLTIDRASCVMGVSERTYRRLLNE